MNTTCINKYNHGLQFNFMVYSLMEYLLIEKSINLIMSTLLSVHVGIMSDEGKIL
jgi:hypothetical protein